MLRMLDWMLIVTDIRDFRNFGDFRDFRDFRNFRDFRIFTSLSKFLRFSQKLQLFLRIPEIRDFWGNLGILG